MKKPTASPFLCPRDLPQALYKLELNDLPGSAEDGGAAAPKRIFTMEQLCRLSVEQMRDIWGGLSVSVSAPGCMARRSRKPENAPIQRGAFPRPASRNIVR